MRLTAIAARDRKAVPDGGPVPLLYSRLKNRCEQRRGTGTSSSAALRFLLSGILDPAAIRLSKVTSNYCPPIPDPRPLTTHKFQEFRQQPRETSD
jgi:hypothetical protein